jgi:hypothetical protein
MSDLELYGDNPPKASLSPPNSVPELSDEPPPLPGTMRIDPPTQIQTAPTNKPMAVATPLPTNPGWPTSKRAIVGGILGCIVGGIFGQVVQTMTAQAPERAHSVLSTDEKVAMAFGCVVLFAPALAIGMPRPWTKDNEGLAGFALILIGRTAFGNAEWFLAQSESPLPVLGMLAWGVAVAIAFARYKRGRS